MRVIFMGTPDLRAVPSLQALLDHGYEVCAVYTQPDKPKGRGPQASAAAGEGAGAGPRNSRAAARHPPQRRRCRRKSGNGTPTSFVVVAYGKILPQGGAGHAPAGGASMCTVLCCPKYRGAAPIQWTVLNGDKTAGRHHHVYGRGHGYPVTCFSKRKLRWERKRPLASCLTG